MGIEMSIGGLKKNFNEPSYRARRASILDKSITIKDILVYSAYGILGLALLAIIVLVPFMLGRASVSCDCDINDSDVKEDKVDAATSLLNDIAENTSETEDEPIEEVEEEEPEPDPEPEVVEVLYDEDERYLRTDSRVAISYDDVDVDLVSFSHEMRGDDWGTIDTVTVMITNNQDKIVIPYSLKMKIYNVGDHASEWWDDEVNLRDHLNIIVPGGYKQIKLDSHVSFSDADSDKRIVIAVFDEVGKEMTSRVREISID